MKTLHYAAAFFAALTAGAAADTFESFIGELPDEGHVVISGTVDDVDNEKEFTLRDHSGKIDVDVESDQSLILQKGAMVTVYGYIDSGLFRKDINATRVVIDEPTQTHSLGPVQE